MLEQQNIEKKYLIELPEKALLTEKADRGIFQLRQTYLSAIRTSVRRLRKIESDGKTRYIFTEKRNITDLGFHELERELTEKEYNMMLDEADPAKKPLCKTRYSISSGSHVLDVDVYPFWKRQAILEIDLPSQEDSAEIPDWIHVIRDVTGEQKYRNSVLAAQAPAEEAE